MNIGDIISVVVTEVGQYGAYVVAPNELTGFIDWYEFSWIESTIDYKHPEEVLSVGQAIKVKVYGFHSDGKFAASIKRLDESANPWLKMEKEEIGANFDGDIIAVAEWGVIARHPYNMTVWCRYAKNDSKTNYEVGDRIRIQIEEIDRNRGVRGTIKNTQRPETV